MSTKAKWILLFITFGLVVSAYLTIKAKDPSSVVCSIGGACEIVLSSRYAYFLGLPTATWGLIWYGIGFFLAYFTFSQHRYPWSFFFTWSAAGLLFSLYLLGLEAFTIHAYCTWCLSSLAAVILIFSLTLTTRKEFLINE